MRRGEIIGMLFIAAGVLILMMEYSLPGLHWVIGSTLLVLIGLAIIWFSSRHGKTREMLDGPDVLPGHRPGWSTFDDLDIGADD